RIVMERIDVVGLVGSEGKLPGEISGGMRKRAGSNAGGAGFAPVGLVLARPGWIWSRRGG
ncbi:hypothetical protein, partial [Streptomyces sp. NPDC002044]|uniref:hypothetical protein n=1 Tax=Streptomyces sp. NPDC002044 TaxID=3154662 RepID=UPI00331D998B